MWPRSRRGRDTPAAPPSAWRRCGTPRCPSRRGRRLQPAAPAPACPRRVEAGGRELDRVDPLFPGGRHLGKFRMAAQREGAEQAHFPGAGHRHAGSDDDRRRVQPAGLHFQQGGGVGAEGDVHNSPPAAALQPGDADGRRGIRPGRAVGEGALPRRRDEVRQVAPGAVGADHDAEDVLGDIADRRHGVRAKAGIAQQVRLDRQGDHGGRRPGYGHPAGWPSGRAGRRHPTRPPGW